MRGLITLLACLSAILFPWPLTALLALAIASFEPLVPLALGLIVDALYYAPEARGLPFFSLFGALVTVVAYLVRVRLRSGIIR